MAPIAAPRVFLSYSTADRAAAERVYADLRAAGAAVFQFEHSATPGDPAWEEIVGEIVGADVFVVLVSANAVQKKPVQEEVRQAHYAFVNSGRPRLISALIQPGVETFGLLKPFNSVSLVDYGPGLAELLGSLALAPTRPLPPPPRRLRWLVPLIVALVIGGGIGAWLAARGGSTSTTTTTPHVTTASTTATTEPATTATGGCVVTIRNPLVTLYETPEHTGQQSVRVPTGDYAVLEVATTRFAGRDERWFKLQVDSREGWIPDDTILIEAKSAGCP